jgi:hypothetical protein
VWEFICKPGQENLDFLQMKKSEMTRKTKKYYMYWSPLYPGKMLKSKGGSIRFSDIQKCLTWLKLQECKQFSWCSSEMVLCPILWGINLLHIYVHEVRWNFKFDSWYSSKICSCLKKKNWHSLHLLFFMMSTLKGDVRVNIFHFTNFFFRPYVKKGHYRIEFVCGSVIF